MSQPVKNYKTGCWMSVDRFRFISVIEQQKQEHCFNVQTDPRDNPLTTRPIWTCWQVSMEPLPKSQFRLIDDPDRGFGDGSAPIRSRTRSSRLELLLTLHLMRPFLVYAVVRCTVAQLPQKLPLFIASIPYIHMVYEQLILLPRESIRIFRIVFPYKGISCRVYQPICWSTPAHSLEMSQLK
jgi:hypothetical protein